VKKLELLIGTALLLLAVIGGIYTARGGNLDLFSSHNRDGVHLSHGSIVVGGLITDDKFDNFERLAASLPAGAVVSLTSPGGYDLPAFAIGNSVRKHGFATYVPAGSRCASACALIWISGNPRIMSRSSRIGFHAPGYGFRMGEERTANYYRRLGLSEDFIAFALKAPPLGMNYLTPEIVEKYGISTRVTEGVDQIAAPSIVLLSSTHYPNGRR
jgi:hypothetical protein